MFGLSPEEWRDLILSVNVRKASRRLTPYQAGNLLRRAVKAASLDTIAKELNSKDQTTLQKILRLSELPEEYASLVDWGNRRGFISMSTAAQIVRLRDKDEVTIALKSAVEEALTKEEARQIVQIKERSGKPVATCIEEALLTRPKIVRHELILGSILSDKAVAVMNTLGRDVATKHVKLALARAHPEIVLLTLKLSDRRFSMMLTAEHSAKLRTLIAPNSVESAITRFVEGLEITKQP